MKSFLNYDFFDAVFTEQYKYIPSEIEDSRAQEKNIQRPQTLAVVGGDFSH